MAFGGMRLVIVGTVMYSSVGPLGAAHDTGRAVGEVRPWPG